MRLPLSGVSVRKPLVTTSIVALTLCGAFWPTLIWLGRTWAVDPYYTHGPIAVIAAAFFAWRARRALAFDDPSMLGLLLIASGLALRASTFDRPDHVVSSFGLILVLGGLAAVSGGGRGLRAAALSLGLLALAVPLPQVARIAPWLAAHAAGFAAHAAGLMGVEVARSGLQLVVGDGAMTVGAPCSGLRSLVALLTLSLVLAGLSDGSRTRRAALVFAAVPIAMLANGTRLVALIWVTAALGLERGLAFFHGPSSAALFLASTAGLVVFGHAMGCDLKLDVDGDELG